jgi:serine/threonine protein phosphatase PrpC
VSVRCAILIATDGLYDMMSNERAVDLAFTHWGDPAAAAEELITETGINDNTHINECIDVFIDGNMYGFMCI